MLSIHCRCVTNILKISMKKFDPENNMIDLQGLNIAIFQQLHIAGGILKALLAANFLFELYCKNYFLARLHEVQKSYCSHPGRTRSRSRSTLLKFSRSLYLDNQLSESIHTWTIGTL